MTYFFIWLLVGAGFQVSAPYTTLGQCEAARSVIERTHVSPDGKAVEKVYGCRAGL